MNDFHPVGRIGKRAGNLPECAYQNIGIDNRANWHAHQNYQHECRNQAPSAAKPEVFQREGFVWVLNVLQIAVRNQEARNYKEQVNANVAAYKLVRGNVDTAKPPKPPKRADRPSQACKICPVCEHRAVI